MREGCLGSHITIGGGVVLLSLFGLSLSFRLQHALQSVLWIVSWSVGHGMATDGLIFDDGRNDALSGHSLHDLIPSGDLRHGFLLVN